MSNRSDDALTRRKHGYNCAQSVACTYADITDVDEKTLFKITEGLGVGLGNMEGTCGALVAACILAGLNKSSGNMEHPDSMGKTLMLSRQIETEFQAKNSTVRCKELKGIETGKVLRTCEDCVRDACELVERYLICEDY